MNKATSFYDWWVNHVKGNYIPNEQMINIIEKFEND